VNKEKRRDNDRIALEVVVFEMLERILDDLAVFLLGNEWLVASFP
jgi:hypothetical protein